MRRILCVLLLLSATSVFAQRLPRTVLPHHYDLTFAPDFTTDRFDGETVIHVTVSQPATEVVLNARDLEFRDVRIESGGKTQKAAVATGPETATLTVAEPLAIGPATIHIDYRGTLNNKLRGLYLGVSNGKKYAATQMEATDAREAFPSFDEPEMKATFAITAIVDDEHTALSNGAQLSDTPGPAPGKHTIRFATTPRMSTYLVAMAIGDFTCIADEVDGIPLRICGTPDKMPLAGFAMDAAKFILPWFNEYYGIRYPFGKLDHIGVADFRAGAMENAGAVLYRDAALFLDPESSTADDLRGTAGVISHETAHMWFGDIVTMRWWDDIWLNEGFASWATSKPLAEWKPEWNMPLRNVNGIANAIAADSLVTSRRIRQQASTPDEIDELFDGIAYGKTAAVLRMIESFIGEEAMRRGVSSYLQQYAFGNATFHDFSDAIRDASEQPIDKILSTFVEQPGVPLLRVSSACENGETVLTIDQQRFFLDAKEASAGQRWTLPVCYGSGASKTCAVIHEPKTTLRVRGCSPLFLNAGGFGYYVTEHSPAMIEALTASIETLGSAERIVLVRDEWNLTRSGRRSISQFLALAEAMRHEREPLVVSNIVNPFTTIREDIASDADRAAVESWVRAYLQPLVKELGWMPRPGEPDERRALRNTALTTLLETGNDLSVSREARKILERELAGRSTLDPSTRKLVIELAAATGDAKLYDAYLRTMRTMKTPDEYYNYFYGLAHFRDPALIRRTLEWALSPEVKNQDAGGLIVRAIVYNPATREQAWTWVEQNWNRIEAKIPDRMLGSITSSTRVFCNAEDAARAKAFLEAHPIPSAARRNAQALERIDQCIALRELQGPQLRQWIAAQPKTPPPAKREM
jgi:aminopeptidase N